jgi:hypothetical protein
VPTLRLQDSLSERFLTSRYLPAMVRRVLAMEDEVHRKSISFDEQSLQQLSVRSRTNSFLSVLYSASDFELLSQLLAKPSEHGCVIIR